MKSITTLGVAALVASLLSACNGDDGPSPAPAPAPVALLTCDNSIQTGFKPDSNTSVLLVHAFKSGDPLILSGTATSTTPTAPADLCLVKLLVGPGNPGVAGAPSTSAGIGIEVWLPTTGNWNNRIRAYGNGGWAGTAETSLTAISTSGDGIAVHVAAAGKGYVVSTSDNGHVGSSGAFAMNPDGTINTVLWKDFAERSLHEQALKTKALVQAFYGRAQRFAYWDGFSTGGRQGLKLAQVYPADYDGILAGAPAINWTRFITNELYPQIMMRQDLGANMATAKIAAVTTLAINACGGATLGFLTDPLSCRYDPTKDASALCTGVAGNAGIVGTNAAATCVSLAEATVMNKLWYGQTVDGSVPDPAADNSSGPYPNGASQLWFGLARGASLTSLAGATPFSISSDLTALELQRSTIATPSFVNATGNGANGYLTLGYAGLANAAFQGLVLQPQFANINTDNADLSAFKGKIVMYHGLSDNLIMPQGSINYYTRVAAQMGGVATVQSFFRFYTIPGLTHSGALTGGATVPLPQSSVGRDELFTTLQSWVENATVPGRLDVTSSNGAVSMPLCVYPLKATYGGSGAVTATASYTCQ